MMFIISIKSDIRNNLVELFDKVIREHPTKDKVGAELEDEF